MHLPQEYWKNPLPSEVLRIFTWDLIKNPEFAEAIMDKMIEFYLEYREEILSLVSGYVHVKLL